MESIIEQIAELVADRVVAKMDGGARDHIHPHGRAGRLLGVREAAAELGIAPSTLYKRAGAGEVGHVKDGSRLLFRPTDLAAYLEARTIDPAAIQRKAVSARRGMREGQ